jgi:putative CocE/NonD family hydrolase
MDTAQLYPVACVEEASLSLPCGTRLDADIYRPIGKGPFPVLLQRQAYSRRIGCTICYAHPAWYAARGFIVVVQDVRGRGTSGGIFRPGETEISDGAASVEWAAALPGSNGRVGMYGFSYQGYNQMLAAVGDCPSLAALAPAMAPWDASGTWMYENGAVRLKQAIGWGNQITAEALRRAGDAEGYAALWALNGNPPLNGPISARPAIVEKYRAHSHVMDWLETPPDDPFWPTISPSAFAQQIRARHLPMLFIGGWFDTHLSSTIEAWKSLGDSHPATRLVVGPWLHFPWTARQGSLDFGPAAACNMDEAHIAFFRQHLCDAPPASATQAPIRLFDMGANCWRDLPAWPDAPAELLLSSTGRAAIDTADGALGGHDATPSTEFIVMDPWRPTPVTGGCYGTPAGPVNRAATDERGDVATFTTAPLETARTIAGDILVEVEAQCDRPSFDLACIVSRVDTSGQVFQISSGYAHFRRAQNGRFQVKLTATLATLQPGEALRLSLAGSAWPAYPINPGTGADPAQTAKVDALVTTIAIAAGPQAGSRLCFSTLEP